MNIKVVRVYMMESEHHLKAVLKVLHDEVKVRHAAVFRAIEGFEKGGEVHSSQLLSLSLNLPLVVEFFDTPETADRAAEKIREILEKGEIITFTAELV
ncbi:MAG: hypothetical protein K1060chlam2_01245 [Chlamydiae bacterium]|nr:hypothetical protein [Chlamydiota bacterium]